MQQVNDERTKTTNMLNEYKVMNSNLKGYHRGWLYEIFQRQAGSYTAEEKDRIAEIEEGEVFVHSN